MVEQGTENPRVGGSTPSLGTSKFNPLQHFVCKGFFFGGSIWEAEERRIWTSIIYGRVEISVKDLGGISMAKNDEPKPTTEQSHPVNDREDKYKVDWAKIDAMTDDEIDYSDIPELPDELFEKAVVIDPSKNRK